MLSYSESSPYFFITGISFIVAITYHTVASANDDTVILRITCHFSQIIDIRYRSTFAIACDTGNILTAAHPDYRTFVIAISDITVIISGNSSQIMRRSYFTAIPTIFNSTSFTITCYPTYILSTNAANIPRIIRITDNTDAIAGNTAYIFCP